MGYLSSPKGIMIAMSALTHNFPAAFKPTQAGLVGPCPHMPADQGRRSNPTPLAEPNVR
jgi:hypothetical protein